MSLVNECDGCNVLFYCVALDVSMCQIFTSCKSGSIHGELEVASVDARREKEDIVCPFHMVGMHNVVDEPGSNCPNFFGRLGRAVHGFSESAEVRSCSSPGLGRKKFQPFKKGIWWKICCWRFVRGKVVGERSEFGVA